MANVALIYLLLQCFKAFVHIFNHVLSATATWFIGPIFTEHIGPAVWPMKLIKVDVIGFQTAQISLNRLGNGGRADGRAVAHIRHSLTRMFGCQNKITPPRRIGSNPIPDDFLGAANRVLGHWIHRIHFRRVQKVYPPLERQINLRMRLGLGRLCAISHRAQTQFRHHHIRTTHLFFAHSILRQLCPS